MIVRALVPLRSRMWPVWFRRRFRSGRGPAHAGRTDLQPLGRACRAIAKRQSLDVAQWLYTVSKQENNEGQWRGLEGT